MAESIAETITPVKYSLTENAVRVLEARYLKRDESGQATEKPDDMFRRVAAAIADIENDYPGGKDAAIEYAQKFYELMVNGQFMPNSPTLMNAGRTMGMLSACFVLPLEDSIDGIFSTVKATAMIQKAGGGTGFSFDNLRPTGDYIKSSGGTTSGPISFWKVLSEATNAIQQGAFRRGANMGMMSLTHPDILKFINAKEDLSAFNNFNISVKVPDHWMKSYREDAQGPHVVINPRTGNQYVVPKDAEVMTYEIKDLIPLEDFQATEAEQRPTVWTQAEVFSIIVRNAWKTGEPGLIFEDEINRKNPTPHMGRIQATNPCGEQPLLPYEACNLGSVNLAKFVETDEDGAIYYNWDALRDATHLSVRFLDNVIDVNQFPIQEITDMVQGNRKIGLGIMGFADALFMMGIPYNSEAGLEFGEKVMKFLNDESHNASEELAEERGSFPNWKGSVWEQQGRKMRNAASTTVAPTGTISIIAGCSGGVEPLFSLAFFRQVLGDQRMAEVNTVFEKVAKSEGFYSEELITKLAQEGTLAHIDDASVPQSVRDTFVCAHDITPEWHIRMQGAFQNHCDSSISKTINLPHEATEADVEQVYTMAFDLKCKGVTVYRDGCREFQPMALDNKKKEEEKVESVIPAAPAAPRRPMRTPSILSAVRIRQNTPFGHMHVTISLDAKQDKELEVFAQLGKAGDVTMSDLEAISRLISLYLRLGGSLDQIIDQLEGIGSHLSIATKDGRVMSLADGLGKTLRRFLNAKKKHGLAAILMGEVDLDKEPSLREAAATSVAPAKDATSMYKIKCPECPDGVLDFAEGCVKCHSCGYSQC